MQTPLTFRTVLFDMDGVLVDVSHSYRQAIVDTVYHFTGREITGAQIQRYKDQGGYNDDWKLSHALIQEASMEVSFGRMVDEFQRRYRGDTFNGLIQKEKPLVTAATLNAILPGRVLGIVTGRPEVEARWAIKQFGWERYFPLLVAMEHQDRRGKPDPYPLQRAMAMLATVGMTIQPEEAVYVGDTGDDVIAARRAGMWCIGHVPPYVEEGDAHAHLLRERGAHTVIRSMDELPAALARIAEEHGAEVAA